MGPHAGFLSRGTESHWAIPGDDVSVCECVCVISLTSVRPVFLSAVE